MNTILWYNNSKQKELKIIKDTNNVLTSFPFSTQPDICSGIGFLLSPLIKELQLPYVYDEGFPYAEEASDAMINALNLPITAFKLFYWLKGLSKEDLSVLSTYEYILHELPYKNEKISLIRGMTGYHTTYHYIKKLHTTYIRLIHSL